MKFQLLIKTKMLKNKRHFLLSNTYNVVFIMLINVKMPTIVGILTFISMIKFMLNLVEQETSFLTSDEAMGHRQLTMYILCPGI